MHAELKTHAHAVANCVSLELECRLFINPGAFEDFGLVIAGEKPAPATSKKTKKKVHTELHRLHCCVGLLFVNYFYQRSPFFSPPATEQLHPEQFHDGSAFQHIKTIDWKSTPTNNYGFQI